MILLARARTATARPIEALQAERAKLSAESDRRAMRISALEIDLGHAREEADRYRPLVEDATDWVWETDADGVLTFSNAGRAPRCSATKSSSAAPPSS